MRKSVFVHGSWFLLVTAILVAVPAFGQAQEQQGDKESLKKAFDASYGRMNELISGSGDPASKADKKHAEAAAQWYIYRLNIKFYVTPTPASQHPVEIKHKEFEGKVSDLMHKSNVKNNVEFRKMFAAALVSSMKNVLGSRDLKSDPTTIIYVAAMLPDIARLKQDEVAAYLCELAKDDKNPAVQLYALKALKETMPVVIQPDPDDFAGVNLHNARKAREIKNVDTLRQFIERRVDTAGMTSEEIKALIFIRREAIISLAQAGAPAVVAKTEKKTPLLEGAVAPALLNVLAGNVQPPSTLPEKVEGALGVCSMRYPNMPEYEPQVGIYLVAKTLDEFVAEYNKDWVNFSAVGAGRKIPHMPFIGDARRLKAGLKELSANTPNPHAKAAKELEATMGPILDKIIGNPNIPATRYGQPEPNHVNQLNALVKQLRPNNGNTFKTLKALQIPLGK